MIPGSSSRLKALSERLRQARGDALMAEHAPLSRLMALLPSLKRLGVNEALLFLRQHWPHIVGEAMARHSTPYSLKDGVLRVQTDSPLFKQELGYAAPRVLAIAQDHLGKELVSEVRAIR